MDPEMFAEASDLEAVRSFAWFLVIGGASLAAGSGLVWLIG